jgi:fructosamine-3-kinase
MQPELAAALAGEVGSRVDSARAVGGGDINDAYEVRLRSGRRLFVKTNDRAPAGLFEAEARGLDWLREAGALRIPEVVAFGEDPAFLALELIEPGRRRADFDERLGRGLSALHRFGAPSFGLDHDNFIGRLHQPNRPCESWPSFYRERRLRPQLEQAVNKGHFGPATRRDFDKLLERLEEKVGPPGPPSRLHGDLWGGNLHQDEAGQPCLIDPAVYGGHREMDLAMMRLFGGFSTRVFAAYEEAWPLPPGHRERVPLYQLYPLLVHVNHFGSGYVSQVQRALSQVV